MSLWNSLNSTRYLNESNSTRYLNGSKKHKTINKILLVTIKNNPSPFSSITWHQKEPWSCVAYSHCSTNDPHIKWIHSYCFPYNCVTKPLAILQRVIKSQRVLILPYISAKQKSVSFLSETFVVKFLDLIFNFPVSRKSNYQKKKKKKVIPNIKKKWRSFFVHLRKCPHTSHCTWNLPHTLADG